MKGIILLNYNENTHQIEDEEKSRFIRNIFEQMFDGTDIVNQIQSIWNVDGPLDVTSKVKLRNLLTSYNVNVIDDLDGNLKIFLENEMVANWSKCTYKLRKDLHVSDPRKRVFLEMHINCWSVFDSPETEQENETNT